MAYFFHTEVDKISYMQGETEYEKALQLTFLKVKRRDKNRTALMEYMSLDPGPKGEYYL